MVVCPLDRLAGRGGAGHLERIFLRVSAFPTFACCRRAGPCGLLPLGRSTRRGTVGGLHPSSSAALRCLEHRYPGATGWLHGRRWLLAVAMPVSADRMRRTKSESGLLPRLQVVCASRSSFAATKSLASG